MMNGCILVLNIVGTFLLSVEAIKIENLIKLIEQIRRATAFLNPRIEWVDEMPKGGKRGAGSFLFLMIAIFSPAIFTIGLLKFYHLNKGYLIVGTIGGSLVFWTLLILLGGLMIKVLSYITAKTAKGTIGISG